MAGARPAQRADVTDSADSADVVVVVDPMTPGASTLRTPDGDLLADAVLRLATREAGTASAPLALGSRTATADALVQRLRSSSGHRLVLVDGAGLTTATAYGDLVAGPAGPPADDEPGTPVDDACLTLQDARGRVLAVRVPGRARGAVADLLAREAGEECLRVLDDAVDACRRAGLAVRPLTTEPFPASWVETSGELDAAWHALQRLDEPALRLRRASRSDDGFLSTFLVRPLSRRLTRVAVDRGLRPVQVTVVALVLGLAAAASYSGGGLGWRLLGSVLLAASLVVDCVDGEVARFTRTTSALGGWLDVGADRVKEYAVYAGLATGVGGAGSDAGAWCLAVAALGLLVTRHFVDFGFAATRGEPAAGQSRAEQSPARQSGARQSGARQSAVPPTGRDVAAWSERTDERPALKWAKRAVIMPAGERTILLVVLTPLVGARWTLAAMLALGVVAAAWTTAGRLGRTLLSRSWTGVAPGGVAARRLLAQLDAAPVPASAWPVQSRAGWLLPAAARVVEQGGVAVLVALVVPEALPAAYAWLAVVATAEYDVVYRQRLRGAVRTQGPLRLLGWPVRVLAVLVVVLALPDRAGLVLAPASGVLALAALGSSVRVWRSTSVASSP